MTPTTKTARIPSRAGAREHTSVVGLQSISTQLPSRLRLHRGLPVVRLYSESVAMRWEYGTHAHGRARLRHRVGGILDLLAGGGVHHEAGTRPLDARAAHQGGGPHRRHTPVPPGRL